MVLKREKKITDRLYQVVRQLNFANLGGIGCHNWLTYPIFVVHLLFLPDFQNKDTIFNRFLVYKTDYKKPYIGYQ